MQNYKTALITAIVALLGVLVIGSLSPSVAQVAVNCNLGVVLQNAIDDALVSHKDDLPILHQTNRRGEPCVM